MLSLCLDVFLKVGSVSATTSRNVWEHLLRRRVSGPYPSRKESESLGMGSRHLDIEQVILF